MNKCLTLSAMLFAGFSFQAKTYIEISRNISLAFIVLAGLTAHAGTLVEEQVEVGDHSRLDLVLPFADEINIRTWERPEVLVRAEVKINDGLDDDIFRLKSRKTVNTISVWMDKTPWKNHDWGPWRHQTETDIRYEIFLPATLSIDAETINGNFILDYYGRPGKIKTISGDIDLTVPEGRGVDFRARTVSGEVYSDLDIDFPQGKRGLKQLVGVNIMGQVRGGGQLLDMKTASGDILLRQGD